MTSNIHHSKKKKLNNWFTPPPLCGKPVVHGHTNRTPPSQLHQARGSAEWRELENIAAREAEVNIPQSLNTKESPQAFSLVRVYLGCSASPASF